MSRYRLIRNYYVDLLDYLKPIIIESKNAAQRDNNSVLTQFNNRLDSTKKKTIINKLTSTVNGIIKSIETEQKYFLDKYSEQKTFKIMYIVMMIIISILIVIAIFFKAKSIINGPEYEGLENSIAWRLTSSILTYLIIFLIILSVFIVLTVNVNTLLNVYSETIGSNSQVDVLRDELNIYCSLIFNSSNISNLYLYFYYFDAWKNAMSNGIVSSDQHTILNYYVDIFKKTETGTNFLKEFSPDLNTKVVNNQASSAADILKKSNNNNWECTLYDFLSAKNNNDLPQCLLDFYADGQGYENVQKIILYSSPVFMLQETNKLLKYYYLLVTPQSDLSNNDTTKTNAILKDIVINPISNVLSTKNTINTLDQIDYSSNERLNTASNFNTNNGYLQDLFEYLLIFGFPIYLKKSDKATDFPIPGYTDKMPMKTILITSEDIDAVKNNIDRNRENPALLKTLQLDLQSKTIHLELKNIFSTIYANEFNTYITSTIADNSSLELVTSKFYKSVEQIYENLLYNFKGDILYPFALTWIKTKISNSQIVTALKNSIDPKNIQDLNSYLDIMTNIIYDKLVLPIKNSYNIFNNKRDILIEEISTKLVNYKKIDVIKYQNIVISGLITINNSFKDDVDNVIELLNEIHKTVNIKRTFELNTTTINKKFIDSDDFITLLNTNTYNDLETNLKTAYFRDIVDNFNKNISTNIALNHPNLNNLFYNSIRTYKLFKTAFILITIIGVLLFIKFIMYNVSIANRVWSMQPDASLNDCAKAEFDKRKKVNVANVSARFIFSIIFLVLIIALLRSYYKKMIDIDSFNHDIIQENTTVLLRKLTDLDTLVNNISTTIVDSDRNRKIESIDSTIFSKEDKENIYANIIDIINSYEKCNFIMEAAKNKIPFPHTDVFINILMILISLYVLNVGLTSFAPIKRIYKIKMLNKMKEALNAGSVNNLAEFSARLDSEATCHNEDMDVLAYLLKIIVFTFIIFFMIYYSSKVLSTANDFKYGLYNTSYYNDLRCYEP